MHRRLHSVLGGTVPGEADSSTSANEDDHGDADPDESFLGRISSYSRLMHAHTKSQLARPDLSTLPSYPKTMHAFTLNQLNSRHASQNGTSSPRLPMASPPPAAAVMRTLMPVESLSAADTAKVMLDEEEVPPAPGNTHDLGGVKGEAGVEGRDFRRLKRKCGRGILLPWVDAFAFDSFNFGVLVAVRSCLACSE